jgi:ADP-dependent NAD(P)H-hydrate dehydratase
MSKKYGITIVLKGYNCIISDGIKEMHRKNEHVAVIKRTTPAMTVGGCSDVLSGIIATLLSKINDPFTAMPAVYLNGIAADLAYGKVGLHMVATDLIQELPNAMKDYNIVIP